MRQYDRNRPLIAIHIPKAAGTSARQFFLDWYGDGLITHYPNEALDPPKPLDLERLHTREKPVVLYGHFSIDRGYGVAQNYPGVRQFVTILRDPFELSVSLYFFVRKRFADGYRKTLGKFAVGLDEFLINNRSHMLNHFPREVAFSNYREVLEEWFVEVGIAEELDRSMFQMANSLGMEYKPALLGRHNVTPRSGASVEHLRGIFMEKNALEYEIYNYVKSQLLLRPMTGCSPLVPRPSS